MNRPFKAVQIGAGSFARQFHGPTLKALASAPTPRLSLEGICDLDLERARAFGCEFGYAKAFTDFHQMIEEVHPDLLYCMVQPSATAGIVEQLLPLRIPLFTEKPPGVTVAEAEELARLADEHRVINYVAFNRRTMPGLVHLKQWAVANGPIRYVRAEMLRNQRLEPEFAIGTAIHPLDYLRALCGSVDRIETRCHAYAGTQARDFLVRLHFEQGILADLAVLVDCGLTREQYLVQVSNQLMETALGAPYACSFCLAGEKAFKNNALVVEQEAERDPLAAGGFMGEHLAFLEAAATGQRPSSCLQDARHSLKLAMAVHQEYSGLMSEFDPLKPGD
jgi:predicted dehydrogenase